MKILNTIVFLLTFSFFSNANAAAEASENFKLSNVRYGIEQVNGLDIFYREAGDPTKQAIVLLHGFPSSSHMYREVLSRLGEDYYLVAPDYPGFGDSSFPSSDEHDYTFDNLAKTIEQFLIQKNVRNYALMIHDYGAPVGFRIAMSQPEQVKAFIVMNGNAYKEGINEQTWAPITTYWKDKDNKELEQTIIDNVFSYVGLQWQYQHGTRQPTTILPDNWNLDFMKLSRPGQYRVQLDLFYDYQNNVALYPEWQAYLRETQPPMLIVWGKNDAFFPVSGAEAYKKDVKTIDFHILDTGHFPLEEDADVITTKMRRFLEGL